MPGLKKLNVYYGDLHNHCGISYGVGSIREALQNARQSLDFCSVTGQAHWPDMPSPNERTQPIIDFHVKGFSKLKKEWGGTLELMQEESAEGRFVVFPSFEIHSASEGDYTILYRDFGPGIIYAENLTRLTEELRRRRAKGVEAIAFPHHIAYRKGARGIDWRVFTEEFSPLVEIVSMHGCSESNDSIRPFLLAMGPADWQGSMQYGLQQGNTFGVLGNTDHHSAHPGSYGGGLSGVWAESLTRESIWIALTSRRTYALTGDRHALEFSINGYPMGSVLPHTENRSLKIDVAGRASIDYVDIIKNNRLLKRFSSCDIPERPTGNMISTYLYLELGWGHRSREIDWSADFGISEGKILSVEPRFRGLEVLSPMNRGKNEPRCFCSHVDGISERTVYFETRTTGNRNHQTNNGQGVCLCVEMPVTGNVLLNLNDVKISVPLARLLEGALSGNVPDEIEAPAWRLHRCPYPWECNWNLRFEDVRGPGAGRDVYYVRVRQSNDQWAWSSPIFLGG